MENSDSTRRRIRPFVKATLAAGIAALGIGVFAAPAFAHSNVVTGIVDCPSTGTNYTVTWTIGNDIDFSEVATLTPSAAGGTATLSSSSVNIGATPHSTPPDTTA